MQMRRGLTLTASGYGYIPLATPSGRIFFLIKSVGMRRWMRLGYCQSSRGCCVMTIGRPIITMVVLMLYVIVICFESLNGRRPKRSRIGRSELRSFLAPYMLG